MHTSSSTYILVVAVLGVVVLAQITIANVKRAFKVFEVDISAVILLR